MQVAMHCKKSVQLVTPTNFTFICICPDAATGMRSPSGLQSHDLLCGKKSIPLQVWKIWGIINNLEYTNKEKHLDYGCQLARAMSILQAEASRLAGMRLRSLDDHPALLRLIQSG